MFRWNHPRVATQTLSRVRCARPPPSRSPRERGRDEPARGGRRDGRRVRRLRAGGREPAEWRRKPIAVLGDRSSPARAVASLFRLARVRRGLEHRAHCEADARVRPAKHDRLAVATLRRPHRCLWTSCRSWSAGSPRTWRRGRRDVARWTTVVQRVAHPIRRSVRRRQGSARAMPPRVRRRQPSITRSSGQTARCGCHGSMSSSSAVPARARATSRRGEGKSTPAHTPSLRPGSAPSRCDKLWESQRSTPGVGTLMISVANGSGSGILSRSPRAVTNRSVRSARCR